MDTPVHKQRGGAQIGWWYRPWPFSFIEIFPDKVIITAAPRKIEIALSDIHALTRWLFTATQFEHNNPKLPEFIVFWGLKQPEIDKLKSAISSIQSTQHNHS